MMTLENDHVPQTLTDLGEREFLRRVRRWFATDSRALALGIGDDAALIDLDGRAGPLVVSTDALIEDVHFNLAWTPPRDLGAKALAVNLSDLAAMAARPVAAFLCLSVPPATPLAHLQDFFLGLRAESRRHGCPLAGGDLTRAPQWSIAVTVLGRPYVPNRPALRAKAQPGQTLYVTGCPGESAAGLAALRAGLAAPRLIRRHNRPTPRLREAETLARACLDLAMLDVSDGIWNDAGQLAEASGVRVELGAGTLWASVATERLGNEIDSRGLHKKINGLSTNPLEWVLFGGEDYELLFATAVPQEKILAAFKKAGLKTPIRPLGRIMNGRGVHLIGPAGEFKIIDQTFRHF